MADTSKWRKLITRFMTGSCDMPSCIEPAVNVTYNSSFKVVSRRCQKHTQTENHSQLTPTTQLSSLQQAWESWAKLQGVSDLSIVSIMLRAAFEAGTDFGIRFANQQLEFEPDSELEQHANSTPAQLIPNPEVG
jgi:hypothetical protein